MITPRTSADAPAWPQRRTGGRSRAGRRSASPAARLRAVRRPCESCAYRSRSAPRGTSAIARRRDGRRGGVCGRSCVLTPPLNDCVHPDAQQFAAQRVACRAVRRPHRLAILPGARLAWPGFARGARELIDRAFFAGGGFTHNSHCVLSAPSTTCMQFSRLISASGLLWPDICLVSAVRSAVWDLRYFPTFHSIADNSRSSLSGDREFAVASSNSGATLNIATAWTPPFPVKLPTAITDRFALYSAISAAPAARTLAARAPVDILHHVPRLAGRALRRGRGVCGPECGGVSLHLGYSGFGLFSSFGCHLRDLHDPSINLSGRIMQEKSEARLKIIQEGLK